MYARNYHTEELYYLLEYWEIDLLNTFGIASGQAMVTYTMGTEHQAVPSKITPHFLLLFIKYESQENPIAPSVGEMAWKFKFVHSIFHEVLCWEIKYWILIIDRAEGVLGPPRQGIYFPNTMALSSPYNVLRGWYEVIEKLAKNAPNTMNNVREIYLYSLSWHCLRR